MTPRRPTAQQIIDLVVRAMYDAREPLDEGLVLVPPVFHVLLHVDAYQELQPLLPRIKKQAVQRLDRELLTLNQEVNRTDGERPKRMGWFRLWIQRLFFADRLVDTAGARRDSSGAQHERAGSRWRVELGVTAIPDADISYLVVESDFHTDEPVHRLQGNTPTMHLQRRTMVLPNGQFETVVVPHQPTGASGNSAEVSGRATRGTQAKGSETVHSNPPPAMLSSGGAASNGYASIAYEDRKGRHVFRMTSDVIRIGRLDPESDAELQLDTLPDVSRVHLCIRYNSQKDVFEVQDLSRFGVHVNNVALPKAPDDDSGWQVLPRRAELRLADVITLTFSAGPTQHPSPSN